MLKHGRHKSATFESPSRKRNPGVLKNASGCQNLGVYVTSDFPRVLFFLAGKRSLVTFGFKKAESLRSPFSFAYLRLLGLYSVDFTRCFIGNAIIFPASLFLFCFTEVFCKDHGLSSHLSISAVSHAFRFREFSFCFSRDMVGVLLDAFTWKNIQ